MACVRAKSPQPPKMTTSLSRPTGSSFAELRRYSVCGALRDYVIFKTADRRFIVHSTLKRVEEKLSARQEFFKVHRSFIVNLNKVVDIEETNLVVGDRMIPISRSNRPVLMKRLNTI